MSPNSIFVSMIRASRWNNSSIPSPARAEISTEAGIFDLAAQREVSSGLTSRPRGADVAVILVPGPKWLKDRIEPLPDSSVKEGCLLQVLEGVDGFNPSSLGSICGRKSAQRSVLFPASRTVRLGEARARASIKKVGRVSNDACDEIS